MERCKECGEITTKPSLAINNWSEKWKNWDPKSSNSRRNNAEFYIGKRLSRLDLNVKGKKQGREDQEWISDLKPGHSRLLNPAKFIAIPRWIFKVPPNSASATKTTFCKAIIHNSISDFNFKDKERWCQTIHIAFGSNIIIIDILINILLGITIQGINPCLRFKWIQITKGINVSELPMLNIQELPRDPDTTNLSNFNQAWRLLQNYLNSMLLWILNCNGNH